MKKLIVNVKQFHLHAQFALNEMRMMDYNVGIYFTSPSMYSVQFLHEFRGAYLGNGIIWINKNVLTQQKFKLMIPNIIFHELRHYYQDVNKMFPYTPEEITLVTRFRNLKRETATMRTKRKQFSREVDAIEFADKIYHKMYGTKLQYAYDHYDYISTTYDPVRSALTRVLSKG